MSKNNLTIEDLKSQFGKELQDRQAIYQEKGKEYIIVSKVDDLVQNNFRFREAFRRYSGYILSNLIQK